MALVGLCARCGYPIYLLGAKEHVLGQACAELTRHYPELTIAGCHHGYFSEAESAGLVEEVRASGAKLLFVAMPTPRKEYWLSANLMELGLPFCMGIGGTLDILAGSVRRAPSWMQRAGMEWVYRFWQEPRRMWRRYLAGNSRFILLTCQEMMRARWSRNDTDAA